MDSTSELNRQSNKAGLPPGALVHVGAKREGNAVVWHTEYNAENFSHKKLEGNTPSIVHSTHEKHLWVNVDGLHDVSCLQSIGKTFGLHDLLLEDVLNTQHRASFQEYNQHVFFSIKMLGVSPKGSKVVKEHLCLVLGENWLLSFQETHGDLFDGIRQRMKDGVGQIRKNNIDYLFYRLIDTVVDNYFLVVENTSNKIEKLENNIAYNRVKEPRKHILNLKKRLINIRKDIAPLREALNGLLKEERGFISNPTKQYLQDVYEHVLHVQEAIDTQRELLNSINDMYQSMLSDKMNQVMQLLTVISTIFIPITFIAGVYGMNFDNIPELHSKYGYFIAWGVMIALAIGMLVYFKRKKWL